MIRRLRLAGLLSLVLAACSPLEPQDFAGRGPVLRPEQFFTGETRSFGVIEARSGAPLGRLRTETSGRMEGGVLVIDQTLRFDDGEIRRRSWRLRRAGDGRYAATATDITGEARGESVGRAFKLQYQLQLTPDSRWRTASAEQWMYLMDDGRTLLSRLTLSKLGVVVATVSEIFQKTGNGSDVPELSTIER